MTVGGKPAAELIGLDGRTLKLHFVGRREYIRAVDVLTAMQDLAGTTGVDIRFLRPVDCHLRISTARQDKPAALARVLLHPLSMPFHLLRDDHETPQVVDEPALPDYQASSSCNGTTLDFSFAAPPDHSVLLQTVFAHYQRTSGQEFTVRRLAARTSCKDGVSSVRLTIEQPQNTARGYFGRIAADDDALFDIWFQPRIRGD